MYVGQDRPDDVFSRQRYHAAVCRSVALRFQICDDHDDNDDMIMRTGRKRKSKQVSSSDSADPMLQDAVKVNFYAEAPKSMANEAASLVTTLQQSKDPMEVEVG